MISKDSSAFVFFDTEGLDDSSCIFFKQQVLGT